MSMRGMPDVMIFNYFDIPGWPWHTTVIKVISAAFVFEYNLQVNTSNVYWRET
jgi:hypothetical protein